MIFDSTVPEGGAEALYCDAVAEKLSGLELESAIAAFSRHSEVGGAPPWGLADVSPPARFRLYRASVTSRSVLGPGDRRIPVTMRRPSASGERHRVDRVAWGREDGKGDVEIRPGEPEDELPQRRAGNRGV